MNCLEINRILDTHAPEELSTGQKQAVELHFASCETCRDAWMSYREIAAETLPRTPRDLRVRIAAAIAARAPAEAGGRRRSLLVGGLFAIGAAVAAGIALQVTERTPDPVRRSDESPQPASPAAPDTARVTDAPATALRVDASAGASPELRGGTAANASTFALDAQSIMVVTVPDPRADERAIAEFAECRARILEQLRAVPGLNVIAGERVSAFDASKLPAEEIARELGAGSILLLKIMEHQASCSATHVDTKSGDERSSIMVFVDPMWQPERWAQFAATVAASVRDATLKDSLTVLSDAEATVLNAALGDAERMGALFKLRRGTTQSLVANNSAIIAAAAQIGMLSRDARAREGAWLGLRGLRDPYLVEPLLQSLANDAVESVRRAAAYDLAYFVDEPGVRDALARAAAEDPSAQRAAPCCIPTVREAAARSLLSDQELLDLALATVMNDALPDRERLQALTFSPDGRALPIALTEEAARSVFDIGRRSADAGIRTQAWYSVGRASPQPEFAQAFLQDLASHSADNVRGAAATGLAHYLDDAGVRTALERASAEDSSPDVRLRARNALEGAAR